MKRSLAPVTLQLLMRRTPAAAAAPAPAAPAPVAMTAPAAAPVAMTAPAAAPVASAPTPAAPAPAKRVSPGGIKISPVAARIAAQAGLNLKGITGSGDAGRIVRKDVEAALAKGGKAAPKAFARPVYADTHHDSAMSPMRNVIASRLLASKQQIPHFYVTEKVNVDRLVDLRAQINLVDGLKITFNDLVVKACGLALMNHPTVNSTFDGSTIRKWHQADISVAVAIPDGLITPIVTAVNARGIADVSTTIKGLVKKAFAGTLDPTEYTGGSFSISNLGMFGIESFNAIVNPPQTSILAVGGMKDEPVIKNGAVVPGKTMSLTLSADHRVVDGADAAGFLKDLREILESPAALLV